MSLGLLGAYNSDLSDSEEDSSSGEQDEAKEAARDTEDAAPALSNPFSGGPGLPKPSFMQASEKVEGVKLGSSVFSNPFRDREDKKAAILEQHVRMTQKQEEQRLINGKKVCWNFRKGRCRHGHRCTFAHDSDIKSAAKDDTVAAVDEDKSVVYSSSTEQAGQDEGEGEEVPRKKKRPGLSDGLSLNKKAMKFYNKTK